jgi:hypothetical protein
MLEPIVRCYFMRGSRIEAVEILSSTNDEDRVAEARGLFEAVGSKWGAQGFEVWDGPRFVYRFPPTPQS